MHPALLPTLLCTLLSALPGLLAAAEGQEAYEARTFAGASGTLPYRLLRPAQPAQGTTYPLVVVLHGSGERGNDNQRQLTHGGQLFTDAATRAKHPSFVIVPQCPAGARWVEVDWGDPAPHRQPEKPSAPMGLLLELLPALAKELPIDQRRIYVMGLSMGGFGTWDLMARMSGTIAAGIPICGGADDSTAAAIARIPVWVFHGADDGVVKTGRSRSMVEALRKAGGMPRYSEYPATGHGSWGKAFAEPELLDWLFAQRRGQ